MKRLALIIILFLVGVTTAYGAEPNRSGTLFPGSMVLTDENGNDVPDTTIIEASSTRTYKVDTRQMKSIFIDIECDQNATVVITPLPDYDDGTVEGAASDTCSITASTPARCSYSDIAAPQAKIVVTNSAGSDMTSYFFTVRGSVR